MNAAKVLEDLKRRFPNEQLKKSTTNTRNLTKSI